MELSPLKPPSLCGIVEPILGEGGAEGGKKCILEYKESAGGGEKKMNREVVILCVSPTPQFFSLSLFLLSYFIDG